MLSLLTFSCGVRHRYAFCLVPGDYTFTAIDASGNGWWGGARYWLVVNDKLVFNEEMGTRSSSRQSVPFEVALPASSRTHFAGNAAPKGGGGACYWSDVPPEHMEDYREESMNSALYGSFAATPARFLSSSRETYNAVSGRAMSSDPITIQITDRCAR